MEVGELARVSKAFSFPEVLILNFAKFRQIHQLFYVGNTFVVVTAVEVFSIKVALRCNNGTNKR